MIFLKREALRAGSVTSVHLLGWMSSAAARWWAPLLAPLGAGTAGATAGVDTVVNSDATATIRLDGAVTMRRRAE